MSDALRDEIITKALRRAYSLGQTFWQQADSESYSQNKKADATARTFQALIADTRAALSAPPPAVPAEPVATVTECEACFTPDACQLRGTCDHYAAERLRIAAAPQALQQDSSHSS